jgi:CP family cyanate transporter-like MFS transporter
MPTVHEDGSVSPDIEQTRRGRIFVLVAILLLALTLRSVPASAGVLLSVLSEEFGLSPAVGGVLTTLPVLCFAVFGVTAARLMVVLGVHRTAVFALALMGGGLVMRGYAGSTTALLIGSTIALSGAAIGNVMLPPLVKLHFPRHVAAVLAMSTAAIIAGATLASVITVPVAEATGNWRDGLLIWAWLAIAVLIPWLFLLSDDARNSASLRRDKSTLGITQAARSPLAWAMAVFFGLQSAQAYTTFGWMPAIYADAGLSPTAAANMLGICAVMGVPVALVLPVTLRKFGSRRLIWAFGVLQFIGWVGLLSVPSTLPWLWAATIGLGGGAFPWVMTMIGVKVRSVDGAAALSGFVQNGGYLIAAAGPLGVGILHDATDGWTVPLIVMSLLSIPLVAAGLYTIRAKNFEDQLGVAR